jgi:prepilin-type N-terminal cleavage/methylation domain-containing protein
MLCQNIAYKKKGFTIMEVSIAILILSALSVLALPRLTTAVERMRSAEGMQILEALLKAQKNFELENFGTYATDYTQLDVTIPNPGNFDPITDASIDIDPAGLAVVRRTGGAYTLTIDEFGTIFCAPSGAGTVCYNLGCKGGAGSNQCN